MAEGVGDDAGRLAGAGVREALGGRMRERLLEWQWSDYAAKHRTRANLRIHMLAVPLFQAGTVLLVYCAVAVAGAPAAPAALCMAPPLALHGRPPRLLPLAPTPPPSAPPSRPPRHPPARYTFPP